MKNDYVTFEINTSFNEGSYSGNYTIKVWDSEVKQITGKSWDELTYIEKQEVKQYFK